MSDLAQRLLSGESMKSIIDEQLVKNLLSHPEMQAAQREDDEWEDRVINGDPSAEAPEGVIRA